VAVASVDLRTRTDADIRPVDAARFLGEELPELAARRGHLAAPGAAELGARPIAIETPSGAWTLRLEGRRIEVEAGDRGAACVLLSGEALADLVNDLKTPMTFFTAGRLEMPRGGLRDFLDWWVVLRSLLDGRPVHRRGDVAFRARDGAPLDLRRSFEADDDPEEMASFLAEAGFLHLRGWFDPEQMEAISADMDRALPTYTEGDGRSWWARTADGVSRCVRMQCFDEHSPATRELLESERFLSLGRLPGDGHQARPSGNRIEALFKPIGVVQGISDVPWHKDCSLGMHSYRCCSLTVGVSVTGADARSGQLRAVAGSHRALVQPAFVRPEWGLPEVDLPTATGDATVHLSCTLHMAQPPVDRERRVLYTGFSLPDALPPGSARAQAFEDVRRVREASYRTVSQTPSPVRRNGPGEALP
jgi:hypothetical protein